MKYGCAKHGVSLERDCYAEQFAEPKDLKFNYIVKIDDWCIDEDESPHKLASRLRKKAERINKIVQFLERKQSSNHVLGRS